MTRLLNIGFTALALVVASPVFAGHKDCKCDQKCAAACKEGKSEKCDCKDCDCSKKGHGCKHGKCGKAHSEKKE